MVGLKVIWSRLRAAGQAFLSGGAPIGGRPWWWAIVGGGYESDAGIDVTYDRAMMVATVHACVRVISESMASMPLILYERIKQGKERAIAQGLYGVLHDAPNPWQSSFEWIEMNTAHVCLRGNAYNRIVPGPRGYVDQLIPLHPDRMKVERLTTGRIRYQYTNERGGQETYMQDEIFHLRGMSLNGLTGLSTISFARHTIGLAIATETHGSRLFSNGARPGVYFKSNERAKSEASKEFVKQWEERHKSAENAHRTAVLPTGLEPFELGINNDDAQFLETRKYQRVEICGLFRVPPSKIGDLDKGTHSNVEQQNLSFLTDCLLAWCRRWEGAIKLQLIDDVRYFAEFLLTGLLRADQKARGEFYKLMAGLGVFTVNDILRLESMNTIGADGDKRLVPLNMTTLDKIGEEEEPPPEPPPADPPPDDDGEPDDDEDEDDEEPDDDKGAKSGVRDLAAARDAARDVFAEASAKLLRWEAADARRMAKSTNGYCSAVGDFYVKHKERMRDRLRGPVRMLKALGVETPEAEEIASALTMQHAAELLAAAERAHTADELQAEVDKVAGIWEAELETDTNNERDAA